MVDTFVEPLLDTDTAARRLRVSPSERPRARTGAINTAPKIVAHDPPEVRQPIDELDKPRTYGAAATALGLRYHTVQRSARGLVPTYHLGTSRPYVKLRDFIDLMERSKKKLTGA